MAELKTKPTGASVSRFIAAIKDDRLRKDCRSVARLMREATGSSPRMWGPSIVGFGSCHLTYGSGRELDWFLVGFAPRRRQLSLYAAGSYRSFPDLLKKLGPNTTGVGCLYIRSLDDVHLPSLKKLIGAAVRAARYTHHI